MRDLEIHGYAVVRKLFGGDELKTLIRYLPSLEDAAGTRNLLRERWCRDLADDPRVRALLPETALAVRGILFDKSASANWNLGWHQDKKIAVKRREDVPGYFAWSEKEGVVHCQAPAHLLERCTAVRIHLDPCGSENGPLRVLPDSHQHGVLGRIDLAN